MKLFLSALALALGLMMVPVGKADEPKREPKPRFKGAELYSWKDDQKGWQFAILAGTNELKTEKMVKTAATVYSGKDKLVEALALLAEGEQVSWSHNIPGFAFPPADDIKAIEAAAKTAKVELRRATQ